MPSTDVAPRIERLSAISARRVIDPDVDVAGSLGDGQPVADELLSIRDLDLDLTPEQRRQLAREEVAAITDEGIRFEAVLMAGFSLGIQRTPAVTEPWVTYALHEMGEETRHSRLFVRLVEQCGPRARNPFNRGVLGAVKRRALGAIIKRPALLYTLVLAGEEIPDLIQKRQADHPATDPFLAAVSRYHRQEEARHLAFARIRLPEVWASSSRRGRTEVRRLAPFIIQCQLEGLLHPGIYRSVGLPGWSTWRAVHRSAAVIGLRHEATRPILRELQAAGAFRAGRVPGGWRRLCGVDRFGRPLAA
jgi:hypothetical protein